MDSEHNEGNPLSFYLGLNYPVTLYPEADGSFTITIMDLPGCIGQSKTVEEAFKDIQAARDRWLTTAYAHGDLIPLPSTRAAYSGKALVNMPSTLHRRLADSARREGISLNQYIVTLLSEQNAFSEIDAIRAKLDEIQQRLTRRDDLRGQTGPPKITRDLRLND